MDKKVKEQLVLMPNDLRNLKRCMNEHIIGQLNKYCPREKGILIHFDKPRRVESSGAILDENPEILLLIKYKAKLFYPLPGKLLVGRLTQVFATHLTCLVFGQFTALLWLCNIQSAFQIDQEENLVYTKTGQKVEPGEYLQFEITEYSCPFQLVSKQRARTTSRFWARSRTTKPKD